MPIEPGQPLLHFRLVEQIGEGGMGVVWKAVDTTLDRVVAIKVCPTRCRSSPTGWFVSSARPRCWRRSMGFAAGFLTY